LLSVVSCRTCNSFGLDACARLYGACRCSCRCDDVLSSPSACPEKCRGVEARHLRFRLINEEDKSRWRRERLGTYISLEYYGRFPKHALTLPLAFPQRPHHQTHFDGRDGYGRLPSCSLGRRAYEAFDLKWSPSRILAGVFYTTTRLRAAPEKLQRMKYDWAIRKVCHRRRPTTAALLYDIELTSQTCGLVPLPQHVLFTEGKVR
jgi:ribosomal protein L33